MSYEYILETDDGDIKLELEITHYIPKRLAKLTGHPDSWAPGESSDLEYKILSFSPDLKRDDFLNSLPSEKEFEMYICLLSRCLFFDPDEQEDEKIVEYLEKQLASERKSAHLERELERRGH